jgi:hypothetical protein
MTEEHERIDFSSLDPSIDEVRWERRIHSIARIACDLKNRQISIWSALAAFAKPALAAAALAACIFVTVAAVSSVQDTSDEPSALVQTEPSLALSEWAATAKMPAANQILEVLGGSNDQK